MKKSFATLATATALVATLALSACSSSSENNASGTEAEGSAQEAEQEQAAEGNTTAESTANSTYTVSIDAFEQAEDWQGNPAIIVTYTWTNNSEDSQMFSVAIDDKAFQNGVQLDTATISGMDNDSFKEIKPGVTQTVQHAYLLEDSSDVSIECSEWLSFSDELLAEANFSLS